uniref:Homeobox domain-containing protein n=1 Tax=Timema genevievae TaxID=629358 RepID=A0A7R9K0A6_TIMGE|nr:unnamed protein product [Timema genevievae]
MFASKGSTVLALHVPMSSMSVSELRVLQLESIRARGTSSSVPLTAAQLRWLKNEIAVNLYPTQQYRRQLAVDLGLTESRVTNWFARNRSSKPKELSSNKDKALNWFGNVRRKIIWASLCEEDQVKVLGRTATGRRWFSRDGLLRTTLKTENPEYLQMEFTQNETEQERRERATDILGSPNCRSQNEKKSSLFYNIDVNVVDASEPFKTVCEDRTESSRPMPHSWSNNDGTGPKNTPLTKKQLMCLRRAFKADPAPKQESYTVLAKELGLSATNQLSILKEEFVVNCYPSKERRKLLSTQLGLRERSVFNWFSRVRRKMLRAELSINNKAARQRILATISKKNKQKDTQIKTGLLNSDIGEYTNKDHSHEQLKEISITPGEPYQSQFKTCRQTEETRGTNQSGDRHKSQVKKCSRGLNKLKNHKHPMVRKGTMCFLYSHQLSRLKEEFVGNGYLTKQGRERVARELCLDKMKVCKWFSDARRKMTWARLNVNKREHREKIVMSYRNRSQILRVQPSWLTTRSVKLAAAPPNGANDETYDNT